jgi:acetoin utilization protein AcuB
MLVSTWMSKDLITIDQNESISEAINLLKKNDINRLLVLKNENLVGIITDRDIKNASPSMVTSLDIWELNYLMSKIKVKEVMTKKIVTISAESSIEKAAILLHDNKIGGLPVVNNDHELVGIITTNDVLEALISITGARKAGYMISLSVPDKPGAIKDIMDVMRNYDFKWESILTSHVRINNGNEEVIIRFQSEEDELSKIVGALKNTYQNIELVRD